MAVTHEWSNNDFMTIIYNTTETSTIMESEAYNRGLIFHTETIKTIIVPMDWIYYSMHGVAWTALLISIICSIITIIWQHRTASAVSFYKRKLGERLVIYLAVSDIFFSVTHFSDHVFTYLGEGSPPKIPCIIFASVLMENIMAQSLIVFLTAASLCLLVTCNRKINFGPFDIGLLIISYGCPLIVVMVCGFRGYLGYQGYW